MLIAGTIILVIFVIIFIIGACLYLKYAPDFMSKNKYRKQAITSLIFIFAGLIGVGIGLIITLGGY